MKVNPKPKWVTRVYLKCLAGAFGVGKDSRIQAIKDHKASSKGYFP